MRILIVDDHQLFIDGIHHIITKLDRDIEILEATSADLALAAIRKNTDIDLVLLDLHMPGLNGSSIMHHPQIMNNCLPVVIISGEDDLRKIKSELDAGAMGFIPKSCPAKELLHALRTVIAGDIYIPATIRDKLLAASAERDKCRLYGEPADSTSITRRQYDVLQLLAKGNSNKQISTKLFLTENTVKVHVSALLRSLGASNRTECVDIARKKGLIN